MIKAKPGVGKTVDVNLTVRSLQKKLSELKELALANGLDFSDELSRIAEKLTEKTGGRETDGETDHEADREADREAVWQKVALARHPDRPYALDYIGQVFDGFIELHGDRVFGDDAAIIGGLAFFDGMPVTIIANQKGRTLKDNMRRNHGMANPEGYRKALRLARQAEKFHRPVITFVDTAGAYPGIGAEERGIGESIARNLRDFSRLATPVICIIIGEGGSGGALGIGVGDKIYMLENAIYSVISPEGAASILLRDATRAKDAAAMLRITSADLYELGLINGVIREPEGGAHTNVAETARRIREVLRRDLQDLCPRPPRVLVRYRSQKILKIGHWSEAAAI